MSSNFKWLPLVGLDLSAANLAAAEKLRKFGFAVNCGEFGSEKYTKAGLCIYDVLAGQDNPNILIVTRAIELYDWYKVLVTTIGADFKIVSSSPDALLFFNEHGASLYIVSDETMLKDNVLKKKIPNSFLWNLIIIDEELNSGVPKYEEYQKNIRWKSERLLINTQHPAKTESDKAALASLVKSVLNNSELAAKADEIQFGSTNSRYDVNSAVMRYYEPALYSDDFSRKVEFVEYGFDESVLNGMRRRVDLKSGLPVYRYGGNIFEEFDSDKFEEEKQIYIKPSYGSSDVGDLRNLDKKLDALIKLCDDVLADEKGRMMIYTCTKPTTEYLHKVLTTLYGSEVHYACDGLFRPSDLTLGFSAGEVKNLPKILLGTDDLGTVGEGFDSVSCIVNYELPMSPVLLERRMTRHGTAGEADRRFVIFRDTNGVFDSSILDKTLYLCINDAFSDNFISRNILLDIPEKAKCVNNLFADLRYIKDFASQVESCQDLIKRVKREYCVPEAEKIANSKQLVEFADTMLKSMYKTFGLSENSAEADIAAAVNSVGGLCVKNSGKIEKAPYRQEMAQSLTDDSYSNEPFAFEAISGIREAKSQIDELHKGADFHLKIKQEISELGDCIQYSVLYGIWKYRAKEQDSQRSFKEYIKIYNDGL
ncbi:MAG: hypothetical protein ACI4JS_03780 [Oscillospiraceae bacterium]